MHLHKLIYVFNQTEYLITPDLPLYKIRFGDIIVLRWCISDYFFILIDKLFLSFMLSQMTFQDSERRIVIDERKWTPL